MGDFQKTNEHGLWLKFTTYSHPDGVLPNVTLLPVVHIAEEKFFTEVSQQKWFADVILFEGAWTPMRSVLQFLFPISALVMRLSPQDKLPKNLFSRQNYSQYKRPSPERAREKVIYGNCKCGRCDNISKRHVWADLDENEARKLMRNIPLSARLAFPFIAIGIVIAAPFVASKEDIFTVEENNHKYEGDSFFDRCMAAYMTYAVGARDAYLQKTLIYEIESLQNAGKQIYVVYGSAHMPPLHTLLSQKLGYKISEERGVLAVSKNSSDNKQGEDFGYGVAKARWTSSKVKEVAEKIGEVDLRQKKLNYSVQTAVSETKTSMSYYTPNCESRFEVPSEKESAVPETLDYTMAKRVLEQGEAYDVTVDVIPEDLVDIYNSIPDHTLGKAS